MESNRIFGNVGMLKDIVSEPRCQFDIESPSGKVVWDCKSAGCICLAGDSFNPKVGSSIPDTKQVKYFSRDPDTSEMPEGNSFFQDTCFFFKDLGEAKVHPLVRGHPENNIVAFKVWGTKWQAGSVDHVQVYFVVRIIWKIIPEKYPNHNPLIGWPGIISGFDPASGIVIIEIPQYILFGPHKA